MGAAMEASAPCLFGDGVRHRGLWGSVDSGLTQHRECFPMDLCRIGSCCGRLPADSLRVCVPHARTGSDADGNDPASRSRKHRTAGRKLRSVRGLVLWNEYDRRDARNFCRRFLTRAEVRPLRVVPHCIGVGRNRCRHRMAMGRTDGRSYGYPKGDG